MNAFKSCASGVVLSNVWIERRERERERLNVYFTDLISARKTAKTSSDMQLWLSQNLTKWMYYVRYDIWCCSLRTRSERNTTLRLYSTVTAASSHPCSSLWAMDFWCSFTDCVIIPSDYITETKPVLNILAFCFVLLRSKPTASGWTYIVDGNPSKLPLVTAYLSVSCETDNTLRTIYVTEGPCLDSSPSWKRQILNAWC